MSTGCVSCGSRPTSAAVWSDTRHSKLATYMNLGLAIACSTLNSEPTASTVNLCSVLLIFHSDKLSLPVLESVVMGTAATESLFMRLSGLRKTTKLISTVKLSVPRTIIELPSNNLRYQGFPRRYTVMCSVFKVSWSSLKMIRQRHFNMLKALRKQQDFLRPKVLGVSSSPCYGQGAASEPLSAFSYLASLRQRVAHSIVCGGCLKRVRRKGEKIL